MLLHATSFAGAGETHIFQNAVSGTTQCDYFGRRRCYDDGASHSAFTLSDYLNTLEQNSIHIIREAHARLKPLALLWSLGRDTNTLIWLTRQAFRARAIPRDAAGHGQRVSGGVCLSQSPGARMESRLHQRRVPARQRNRPDAAAGRTRRGAQDAWPEGYRCQARPARGHAGHSPRRAGDTRQGTHVQSPPRGWLLELPRPARGILGPVPDRFPLRSAGARASAARMDRPRYLALHRARMHSRLRAVFRDARPALSLVIVAPEAGRAGARASPGFRLASER